MLSQTPLPSRSTFLLRLVRHALLSLAIIAASLGLGAFGYHEFVGLEWLDAVLNASMILTGMGPIAPLTTPTAKLFGIGYSLFSGVAFLTFATVLLAPVAHRFLHRFHLDLSDDDEGVGPHAAGRMTLGIEESKREVGHRTRARLRPT